VSKSGRPARGLDALSVTPFLLGAILAALVSTGALIATWYADADAGPATSSASLVVAVGLTSVAWASVVFAICRETILRRLDELGHQLGQQRAHLRAAEARLNEHFSRTAADLVEQAEESGVFRGMDIETRRPRPARPEGGQVIRHPRLAQAPDRPS
jgi:hypothetical protein